MRIIKILLAILLFPFSKLHKLFKMISFSFSFYKKARKLLGVLSYPVSIYKNYRQQRRFNKSLKTSEGRVALGKVMSKPMNRIIDYNLILKLPSK